MGNTSYNRSKNIESFNKRKIEFERLMRRRRRRTYRVILFILLISIGGYIIHNSSSINGYSLFLINNSSYKIKNKLLVKKLDKLDKDLDIKEVNYEWNRGELEYNNPKKLIIHHAAISIASPETIHKWHLDKGYEGIGYHYYIKKDGTIYKGRDEKLKGAHAINENATSIGICLEGNYQKEHPSKEQVDSLAKLSSNLIIKYNIEDVLGHRDCNKTLCPGGNVDINEIKLEIIKNIEGLLE